jgi:hypothetical protein
VQQHFSINIPRVITMMRTWLIAAVNTVLISASFAGALHGKDAYGDWRSYAPGICRHITASDLPDPYAHQQEGYHGDEMRCGLESLRVSEPRFRELGFPGFAAPFSVN